MRNYICLLPIAVILWFGVASATIINVPGQFSTIQMAIDSSLNGDTVLVERGIYPENIDYGGKGILVTSNFLFSNDWEEVDSTIIFNEFDNTAVTFQTGETESSILQGLTIINRCPISSCGASIEIYNSSPQITNNLIKNSGYVGIAIEEDAPLIAHNIFYNDSAAAILVGSGTPLIHNNTISSTMGTGIELGVFGGTRASIKNNCIVNNDVGIYQLYTDTSEVTYNNVWNNQFADFYDFDPEYGDTSWGYNANGTPCDSFQNIRIEPLFVNPGSDFNLHLNSPCIDAGDPGSPLDPDSTIADIGALYFDQSAQPCENPIEHHFVSDSNTVGLWHFCEGTGNLVADSSDHQNNLTLYGPVWTDLGIFGNAVIFDGQDDSAQANLDDLNFITGPHTCEAWVWLDSLGPIQTVMSLYGDGQQIPMFVLGDSSFSFRVTVGDSAWTDLESKTRLETEVWYHLAGQWDGFSLSLFVDGEIDTSIALDYDPTPLGDSLLDIGKLWIDGNPSAENYFHGRIDEVRISNSARFAVCNYAVGDVNNSGDYNGLDVTYGVAYFKGGDPPLYECECTPGHTWYVSGNVNGDCTYNGLDIGYGVNFLKGGPALIPCPDCPPVN